MSSASDAQQTSSGVIQSVENNAINNSSSITMNQISISGEEKEKGVNEWIEYPVASIQRILKTALPEYIGVSKEAKARMAQAAAVFTLYLADRLVCWFVCLFCIKWC